MPKRPMRDYAPEERGKISVYLEGDVLEQLRAYANYKRLTMSKVARDLIIEHLDAINRPGGRVDRDAAPV